MNPTSKRGAALMFALSIACQSSTDPAGPDPSPVPGPGDYSRTIVSGGLTRSYDLHVPPAWSSGAELPLVLAFHGAQNSPAGLRTASGLDRRWSSSEFA